MASTRTGRADPVERRALIVRTARQVAEAEGWEAVTTRRLADEIGHSQPVLYGHFPDGKTGITTAVALEGFTELAERLERAVRRTRGGGVRAVAREYLAFADDHPATYSAMFSRPLDAPFAAADTPEPLRAGFTAIASTVGGDGTAAEVLWSCLHGLVTLERDGRLPPPGRRARLDALVARFG